jgi:uroporphyrinogen-III decarboxylase
MKDLYVNEKMAEAILDKLLSYMKEVCKVLIDMGVDIIRVNEDWGTQTQLFINTNLWKKYFKPRYKALFNIPKKAGVFVYFHSDGNITPIVGDLIDCGIDVLNPVQPECMNPVEIKSKYGDKITIHTGCSVQRTLPYGTIEDVRKEVLEAIKNLAPGGGFMYGTSHRVLYGTPVENVVTLYETCHKYGRYPIKIP